MKPLYVRNAVIALIAATWLMGAPLYAETPGSKDMGKGMMGDHKASMAQVSDTMHEMANAMLSMSGDMGKGDMNAARQKQLGEHLRKMAVMLDDMSGMMSKGIMMQAEQQQKISEMRKQVEAMSVQKSVAPDTDAKKKQHIHSRDGK